MEDKLYKQKDLIDKCKVKNYNAVDEMFGSMELKDQDKVREHF